VNGLVTAGNSARREVWTAAWASVTKVSRQSSWLSRMPTPSKPAASTSRISAVNAGSGIVPGTLREA